MAVDWVAEAAEELRHEIRQNGLQSVDDFRKIILKHAPFKPDTAYMEVPRCEACKHWEKVDSYLEPGGRCLRQEINGKVWSDCGDYTIMTSGDFGCIQWEAK